jgi:hypothetical protein
MENQAELSLLTAKLEQTLTGRSRPIQDAIAQIERTGSLLDDYIFPVQGLQYLRQPEDNRVKVTFKPDFWHYTDPIPSPFSIHENAFNQMAFKLNIPSGYLKELVRGSDFTKTGFDWKQSLGQTILQTHSENSTREKAMLRTVEGQVRGFVSDRYRRLNTMQIFMAFLQAAAATGNVLVDAHSGETKGFLEVINPHIIEFDTPLNGRNYMVMGARIRNSDFGDGALEVYVFSIMVKCMNGLVGESRIRERHLGSVIPDDIKISEETYRLDTEAKASLVGDVMRQIYLPETTETLIAKIKGASAKEIDLVKEVTLLPKVGLTVTEAEAVGRVLMENNPVNGLQGGSTLWKLVNGLTAVARESTPERKRELELIASNMI